MNKDHIFVCFNEGRHKIALMLFVVFTKVFRGLKLQIEFFERADPETYNLMISSISFLFCKIEVGQALQGFMQSGVWNLMYYERFTKCEYVQQGV